MRLALYEVVRIAGEYQGTVGLKMPRAGLGYKWEFVGLSFLFNTSTRSSSEMKDLAKLELSGA
jgi:hypothetical protein